MDPNAALAKARQAHLDAEATRYKPGQEQDEIDSLRDLSEAFNDLDDWLSKGGFLPEAWDGARATP